jgi:hypothetical protein
MPAASGFSPARLALYSAYPAISRLPNALRLKRSNRGINLITNRLRAMRNLVAFPLKAAEQGQGIRRVSIRF